MIVHISHNEAKFLKRLGAARNAAKRPEWTRRQSDVFTDRQVDILGCVGELAGSKVLDVPMDESIAAHGDSGIDLVRNGETFAVKYNHRIGGYLIVEGRDDDTDQHLSDLVADHLICITGRCTVPGGCICAENFADIRGFDVTVAGTISSRDFLRQRTTTDWGLGVRHYVRSTIPPLRFIK